MLPSCAEYLAAFLPRESRRCTMLETASERGPQAVENASGFASRVDRAARGCLQAFRCVALRQRACYAFATLAIVPKPYPNSQRTHR